MDNQNADRAKPAREEAETGIDQKLVKALAHPMRVRILEALQGLTASPTELAKQWGESLGVVSYHVNFLLDVECIEQVRTRPRRGTIEHFYTAVPRSFIGHQDWRRAPFSVRAGVTNEAIRTLVDKVGAAVDAGTIDSREDTTLNWMPMTVDEQGWREAAEILDGALRELMTVATESRKRLGPRDGIPMVTAMAAFEAPPRAAGREGSARGRKTA